MEIKKYEIHIEMGRKFVVSEPEAVRQINNRKTLLR